MGNINKRHPTATRLNI